MKVRNKTFVKQVMIRDMGLCRCCGFKASEVHHIKPLVFYGDDNPKNMISLCSMCHRDSPDSKKEFYEYMNMGGSKTQRMLGVIVHLAQKRENETKGVEPFIKNFNLGKHIIKSLRDCDIANSIETYDLWESLQVEDVNFSDILTNNDKKEKSFNIKLNQSVVHDIKHDHPNT